MELDEFFIRQQPGLVGSAGGGLLAGVNELAANDTASRRWIRNMAQTWTDLGMASIHLELGDYAGREGPAGHLGLVHGLIDSIGMSLSELRGFFGSTRDPGSLALQVAETVSCRSVYVHADGWSFAVHRDSPREILARLLVGNLLAASRAARGSPSNRLGQTPAVMFADDYPVSGDLRDGWRLDCVPSPYLRNRDLRSVWVIPSPPDFCWAVACHQERSRHLKTVKKRTLIRPPARRSGHRAR